MKAEWRRICRIVGLLLLTALMAVDSGAADDEPAGASKRFLAAYDSMKTADWTRERGMQEDAIELYTEALSLFRQVASEYPNWYTNVVAFRIAYCEKERTQVLTAGGAPVELPAKSVADMFQTALRLEGAQDYTGALKLYTALLAAQPKHTDAIKGAVRCYLRLGPMDPARTLAQKGLALSPADPGMNHLMGLVCCYDRDYTKAVQWLTASLRDNPMNADAHVALGVALMGLGRADAAQEEMRQAISLNIQLGEAYYNLARMAFRKKPVNIPLVRMHYQHALQYGAEPDPKLDKLMHE